MLNKYKLIACINNKNAIAKDGKPMFGIKADVENFNSLTNGHVVIMGRNTFEKVLNKTPLKNRVNIIVTTNENYTVPTGNWTKEELNNTFIVNSLTEADNLCYAFYSTKDLYIIGGGETYYQAYNLGMIDEAIITVVSDEANGDMRLPDFSTDPTYKVIFKTTTLRDHPNDIYYKYIIYKKR
jgi:dihydrofolate reductase